MRRQFSRQRGGLVRRAVGHHDARGAGARQRQQRAARGAARAQHQHGLPLQGPAQVDFDVAHQADAVEVARLDAPAGGAEGGQRTREAIGAGAAVDGFVDHVLPRRLREQAVDEGGFAVGDGVADDGVTVGHAGDVRAWLRAAGCRAGKNQVFLAVCQRGYWLYCYS